MSCVPEDLWCQGCTSLTGTLLLFSLLPSSSFPLLFLVFFCFCFISSLYFTENCTFLSVFTCIFISLLIVFSYYICYVSNSYFCIFKICTLIQGILIRQQPDVLLVRPVRNLEFPDWGWACKFVVVVDSKYWELKEQTLKPSCWLPLEYTSCQFLSVTGVFIWLLKSKLQANWLRSVIILNWLTGCKIWMKIIVIYLFFLMELY